MVADGTQFRFGKDSDGNYGYIITDETGADSVIPFKSGSNALTLWCTSIATNQNGARFVNGDYFEVTQSGIPASFKARCKKTFNASVLLSTYMGNVNDGFGFNQGGGTSIQIYDRTYVEGTEYMFSCGTNPDRSAATLTIITI